MTPIKKVTKATSIISTLLLSIILTSCSTNLPNGCVVEAQTYAETLKAKNKLGSGTARILVVKFKDQCQGHAYCIFRTMGGEICCYDGFFGTQGLNMFKDKDLMKLNAKEVAESINIHNIGFIDFTDIVIAEWY